MACLIPLKAHLKSAIMTKRHQMAQLLATPLDISDICHIQIPMNSAVSEVGSVLWSIPMNSAFSKRRICFTPFFLMPDLFYEASRATDQ